MTTFERDFDTLAAQAGIKSPVGEVLSTAPPIVPSTTFTYDSVDAIHKALTPEGAGYAYARNSNPTVASLERALARLEGAEDVVAFASGMAAIHATLMGVGLSAGDIVVAASDLYGVTRSLLLQLENFDIHTEFVDVLDVGAVENALAEHRPRLLYFESLSNPVLRVPDVGRLVALAKESRALVAIDNTFATPFLFRPLQLGADIVLHSATKYVAGHGDAVAGVVAAKSSISERIRTIRTLTGGIISPFEAWLTLRGVRTLPVRMERHCSSAMSIAQWLASREWVTRVHYPGLPGHPQHERASAQLGGRFGGMVAVEVHGDRSAALRFMDALEVITPGTSLGDVESLALYPPLSSHRGLSPSELKDAGISDSLIRLSIGLESPEDLMRDMERAARAAHLLAEPSAV